jgi:hypothetical protein
LWEIKISLKDARKLSKNISKDFNIPYCQIYYVDTLGKWYGIYHNDTGHIHTLIEESCPCRIGIVIHELTHHLEYEIYGNYFNDPPHGYKYQLAKERMVSWCRKNISTNPNWYVALKGFTCPKELKTFKL